MINRLCYRRASVLSIALLLLSSCGGGGRSVVTTTSSVNADGVVNVEALNAQVATFLALSPDKREARLAELDAQLERQLWTLSGLEAELGGPAAADAAFAEHSRAIVGRARASGHPRLVLAGFGLMAPESGPNIGLGLFGGFMVIALGAEMVSSTNDLKDGETGSTSNDGLTAAVSRDNVQIETAYDHDGEGVTTKLRTKMEIKPCPDASGQFDAKATVDISVTKTGDSTGQHGTLDVTITGQVDDDAKLASSDADYRMQWADFAGGKGSFVDLSGAIGGTKVTKAALTRSGGAPNAKLQQDAAVTGSLYAMMASMMIGQEAEKGWQSGRCVILQPTAAPGPKGLKPGSTSRINAAPRSRIDGTPVGGTVRGTLSAGGRSVDPAGSKVPAAATFTYAAPGQVDQSGTVSLEARSRRGVANASIDFDTKAAAAYQIVGGLDYWQTNTAVCDIMQPFTLTGGGFTMQVSGGLSGTYTYTGPFNAHGTGTYTISLPGGLGKPGTMTGGGVGSAGGYSNTGTERYTLSPLKPCS